LENNVEKFEDSINKRKEFAVEIEILGDLNSALRAVRSI
jgi:hypothetical protein